MATGFSATPRKEGSWTKLVIFITLYCLVLESILQWVLVLFLYGRHQVDSKMTLSLVLSLVSSFLSVPLVSLQSLVAWQYNKIGGFGEQKTVLHNVCTYVLRLSLMLWLATSVCGLVVAAQQVYCLPDGSDASYWRVGTSCAFHRAAVIASVVSLVTVCTLYCARELCDRPYDVSLLGIYKRQNRIVMEDGSIFSGHSWDSDETLKNEILNLCRQHDGKAGCEPWYFDPLADKVNCHPSIKHPAPVRLRPQLTVNTDPGSEYGEITSGTTTASPDDTLPRVSPGGQTLASDLFPISRTSTVMTSDSRALLGDMAVPKVPPIPENYISRSYHKRGKSSLSSLKRFLPKPFPFSRPLSMDPQIRALSNPNAAFDIEKQVVMPSTPKHEQEPNTQEESSKEESQASSTATTTQTTTPTTHLTISKSEGGHTRTMTMNSADAPEVVPSSPDHSPSPTTTPTKARRPQTAIPTPTQTPRSISIHHPHHPNYTPVPSPGPANPRGYTLTHRQNTTILPAHPESLPLRRSSSRQARGHMSMTPLPTRSTSYHHQYQFDHSHIPRHTQTTYQPAYYHAPTRWGSQPSLYEHARPIQIPSPSPTPSPIPRRNDVEVIYPSTRRARSSTHGILNGSLSCIMESSGDRDPRASGESIHGGGGEAQRNVLEQNTYRGANRTSMIFY